MRFALFAVVLAVAAGLPKPASAQTFEPLAIETGGGLQTFLVEVARDDADRAQGLMYRRTMAPDRGMLFDFARTETVSMWMKNTYLSLDMIFVRPDGIIANVAEHTEPLSTRIVSSSGPVLGVLEVVAGTARRLGIKAGDRVQHPLFGKP